MELDNLTLGCAIWYLVTCAIVGTIAKQRGHRFSDAFFASLIATPVIGAILFHSENVSGKFFNIEQAWQSKDAEVKEVKEAEEV